ncbi:hypothetical protein HIM_01901 [Hirsutella minnesotensis 3608]|nr:hypothetical protein HIM_01901 [Hirsutella minnesotensis 3608]
MPQVTNVYVICGIAAIGGGLFGFDISSMSGVIGTQAYKQYFGHPGSYVQGGITASMPAGSLVGSLMSSVLADRLSRRVALQISCVFWLLGSAIQCGSQNVVMLCAGRATAGLCVGVTSSVVPIYQSEVAPKEIRGRVVSLQQWAITWGILIQYFIQYGVAESIGGGPRDPRQPTAAFRIPWAVQMIPACILLVGLFFCPHSPRWLASQDRWSEALLVLADLHGGGDARHRRVLAQYREIEDALRVEREQAGGRFSVLLQRRMLKRLVLGMSIQAWSQLCGMNIMMYYIVYVMEGAQIGSPLLTASIQYIINVLLTLPAILFLDKWGRRPSLIVGSFLMMTWLFISGVLQQYYGQPNTEATRNNSNKDVTWIIVQNRGASCAIVTCSYLFVATFATTWGPTSWTYPAEIFPSMIRAKAVSLSTATNWLFNMALAFAVPPLCESVESINAAAFLHMFLTAHETKGYTLEEMDDAFDSGSPAWRPQRPVQTRLEMLENQLDSQSIAKEPGSPAVRERTLTE